MDNYDSYYDQLVSNRLYKSSLDEQYQWHECQGNYYPEYISYPDYDDIDTGYYDSCLLSDKDNEEF